MKKQFRDRLALLGCIGLLASVAAAAAPPDNPVPPVGQTAGKFTALLPTTHIVRGEGKKAVITDGQKGTEVIWQDLIRTEKGGRARITLNDQSILSLGSQAELRIVKHDAKSQQTALEMTYGRVRAQVSTLTRDGSSFQVKTPTAVAGVIGTDFGMDSSVPGETTFVCISGLVQVGNADPKVPGAVPCAAGQTTTVKSGMPPSPPKPASQQQINQLIIDTEPASISAFAPASALTGTTLDAVATGTHMAGIKGVTIAGTGVQASLGTTTATSAAAHLVIAPTAQPGPRTVTFTKPNGANTAAIFNVIAPGTLTGTDAASLKKRYTDILISEIQAADGSNTSFKSALQQEVDQGLQAIQQNNQKLPQPVASEQVAQQLTAIVANFAATGSQREQQIVTTAEAAIDAIVGPMESKIQNGSEPVGNIAADLDKQFAPINQTFQSSLNEIHNEIAAQAATQIQAIEQIVSGFEQTIAAAAQQQLAAPTPKTDAEDKTIEVGATTSFDASGSTAINGASIASVNWTLCDPSYHPAQVGVVLPGNAPGCRALPGFAATGGQFQINSCTLNPADYIARVIVADSNGKSSAMDVRLHVSQGGYDDPQTRLRGLAAAYSALQSQQFLAFFDPISFSGYTALQENVRETFLKLDSMQINLRVSQSNITCNDATLRADWNQIYTFKGDQTCANSTSGAGCQKVLFRQNEQLSARMTRVPGRGWFLTDFQGDNGTVQGVAPGPQTTQTAQPSLQVTGIQVVAAPTATQQRQLRGSISRATTVAVVGLVPGDNHFVATVANIGKAALTTQPKLRFSLLDSNGNEIAGQTVDLPILPLNPGASESVTGTIVVPSTLPPATPVNVDANVNPGCQVQEDSCGAKNVTFIPAVAGTVDVGVLSITPVGQYLGTQTGTVNVTLGNSGTAPSIASSQGLVLTSPDFGTPLGKADVPSIPANGTAVVPISFVVPNAAGQHLITATISPAITGDSDQGNDSLTSTLQFAGAGVDLQISALSFTQGQPPFAAGETHSVSFTVTNAGSAASNSSDTFSCSLNNSSGSLSSVLFTGTLPVIAAGATSGTLTAQFVVPSGTQQANFSGASSVSCTVVQDPLESASQLANNTASRAAFINAPSYVITSIASATTPNPPTGANALQVGQDVSIQVTIGNTGTASPQGSLVVQVACQGTCQLGSTVPVTTVAAPAAGQSIIATLVVNNLQLAPAAGYVATASITSAPVQSSTAGNSANVTFDVTDFTLTNDLALTGDLNVKIGGQGIFNVSLAEPQGTTPVSIPMTAGPALSGVTYGIASPFANGSSNPVVVAAGGSAPAGTSAVVTVSGSRFGVIRSASQSVRFFTASLENFSTGQPGSNSNQPIILPVNGPSQSLNIRLTGNFYNPGGGAQLSFPTTPGINITPSATVAAAGDVIQLQISAVQGAAANQTIPLVIQAQVPNMNPAVPELLTVFVRPTALPDLAVSSVSALSPSGAARDFTVNPWLSGEPIDFNVTVMNNGPGATQGFELLHLFLNGQELTHGVTVPQALAPGASIVVKVHVDAPDPLPTSTGTVLVKVDEDSVGDSNSSNDSLSIAAQLSDWKLDNSTLPGGTDSNSLGVSIGGSNSGTVNPVIANGGSFLTPISFGNGAVSSRITATPGVTTITTAQPISYVIGAAQNAASGFYVAQFIAKFLDGGRPTAQRQVTIHVSVQGSAMVPGMLTVTAAGNNLCGAGCTQINGLLIENETVTVTNTAATASTATVDLHFTDPASIVSNVSQSGNAQSSIINGISYAAPTTVYFAAGQDATGAVLPGSATVVVSATSIQTSAKSGGPTPDPVGPNTTNLLFNVGDLQLASQPCFNLAPGTEGVLQLTFSPLAGFNVPNINWSVSALPPGVVLNSITPTSSFSGGSYSPLNIDLTNTNPVDVTPAQPITLVGTIFNANGSATVTFAPAIQLHTGACIPGGARNAALEGAPSGGTRGVWHRGATVAGTARLSAVRQLAAAAAAVRFVPGEVTFTPSMPKSGDTVQVRFRLANSGSAAAQNVPVAIVVNGAVVASDTFDIGAGRMTLGGLQWTNAQLPASAVGRPLVASLVIDPTSNAGTTVASGKIAPLQHFSLTGLAPGANFSTSVAASQQRAIIQLNEAACAGFRFSSGAGGSCSTADLELSLEDAAAGRLSLASTRGIADLGMNPASANAAQYGSQLPAIVGHSYAVPLGGGRTGILTIRSINNPRQNAAAVNRVFRGGSAGRLARTLGKASGPVETGDTSGASGKESATATIDLTYVVQ